jgi:hypothetical protein
MVWASRRESQWLNGPIERNYGLELSVGSDRRHNGLGFDANVALQRAYYDRLSPSFYALAGSTAINGAQIGGIPYASAHGEISFTRREKNFRAALGADYVSANNWTNGPGFTTYYATLRSDLGTGLTLNVSAANLFDHGTGSPYGFAVYNGGFATPQLGPNASGTGLAYSSIPQFLQSIPPVTVRFSLSKQVGWK